MPVHSTVHSASAAPGHGTIVRAIISRPVYAITVDVLTQLLEQFGQLMRMSIFHRSDQVHALVEFATAEQAQAAIASTNGRDIYEGSCTVQAELSNKRAPMDVRVANERNRDFTKPDLMFAPTGGMSSHEFACRAAAAAGYPAPPAPSLPTFLTPPHGSAPAPGMIPAPGMPPPGSHMPAAPLMHSGHLPHASGHGGPGWTPPPPAGPGWAPDHRMPPLGPASHAPGRHGPMGPPGRGVEPPPPSKPAAAGPVVTLSNMNPEHMTVQRIINLLCVFGNVVAVQRNTDIWTEARVEMEDARQARGTAGLVSGLQLFGHRLQVDTASVPSIPRQTAWSTYRGESVLTCLSVPAGHLRRFASEKQFGNIYSPSRVLYLSNGPPQLSVAWLSRLFKQAHAPIPQEAAWFPQSSIGNPRKGCILRFNDIDQAVHALVLLNNLTVDGHTMKLAFTQQQWKPGRNMPVEPVPVNPSPGSLPSEATAGSPSWAAGLDARKRGRHEPEAEPDPRARARPRM